MRTSVVAPASKLATLCLPIDAFYRPLVVVMWKIT